MAPLEHMFYLGAMSEATLTEVETDWVTGWVTTQGAQPRTTLRLAKNCSAGQFHIKPC